MLTQGFSKFYTAPPAISFTPYSRAWLGSILLDAQTPKSVSQKDFQRWLMCWPTGWHSPPMLSLGSAAVHRSAARPTS
jgi:hypothetical protein